MNDCLFCKIISGEIPSEKIYENKNTFAFLDISPNNPGHTLVIPKKHSTNLFDIEESDWLEAMKTVRFLAPIIEKAVEAKGINIAMNNKEVAGQVIDHSHIHIIPRHKEDGYRHWPGTPYKDDEAERVAEKIKKLIS
jgi:histidine triad (HIT) family protein